NLEERLLGLLDALGDRRGHLLGLAVADADGAVTVADDDERGEAEAAATLDDLRDPVDGHDALKIGILLGVATVVATVAVAAAVRTLAALATFACGTCASTLGSWHQSLL